MKKLSRSKRISSDTIKRLSLYLHNLRFLEERNVSKISSSQICNYLEITPEQFRKDLSCFGEFGKRGVGYNVKFLIQRLEEILGVDTYWEIALVGAGRLGGALLGYPGFENYNLKIIAAFDNDPKKVGKKINGVEVKHIRTLKETVNQRNIKVGILCVQAEGAQAVADLMMDAGIKAILNFSPINIYRRQGVFVSGVNMAAKLESLIFQVNSWNK